MDGEQKQEAQSTRGPGLQEWLQRVGSGLTWDWKHLAYIQGQLERITRKEIDRLMLFVPPRHGKSTLATIHYPVYRLQRDPKLRVIIAAYNQSLANRFSRQSRRLARQVMGDLLSKERTSAEEWETTAGGGMRAVGVGGGITGQGGNLIIIDDPVKSREEAESPGFRERVYSWYTDDLFTRLEPEAAMILILTRWHMDDLAGRILQSEEGKEWTVVRLPAEAETQEERDSYNLSIGRPAGEPEPLRREPGQALCEDRYDEKALARIRSVLRSSYHALYQQRPVARDGGFFKRSWFTVVEHSPREARRVRYWDKAGTEDGGDFTVGVLMARTEEGLFYVEDVVRGQWSSGRREQAIRETAALDGERYGELVQIWVEQEPGSGGKESALWTVRQLAGYDVRVDPVTGDKKVRAHPFAAQAEAGLVRLVRGAWNADYLEELALFPNGKHKDQVDASSGAFNKLTGRKIIRLV